MGTPGIWSSRYEETRDLWPKARASHQKIPDSNDTSSETVGEREKVQDDLDGGDDHPECFRVSDFGSYSTLQTGETGTYQHIGRRYKKTGLVLTWNISIANSSMFELNNNV